MTITMLSHTFAMTHNLTRFESAGDRHRYRMDDGRDIVAKPVDNPAYPDGLRYYSTDTPEDVEAWMTPGREAALRELSESFAAATSSMAMPVNPSTGNYNVTSEEVAAALAASPENVRADGTLTRAGQAHVADTRRHLPDSALDPAPEGWEDYELVNAAQHAAQPGDVWMRFESDDDDEPSHEANTYAYGDRYVIKWYHTGVGLVQAHYVDTLAEAHAWYAANGYADFSS